MIDNYLDFERVGRLLEGHEYKFAKTMPKNPHWYTLRKTWDQDDDFVSVVEFIRANGYEFQFWRTSYTQLNVNNHYYWTMGAPIPETILINRKVVEYKTDYTDKVAGEYDQWFSDPNSLSENQELFARLGDTSDQSVLDIGCGTGLFLEYSNPALYMGIDPSKPMLTRLEEKHLLNGAGRYQTVNTPLRSFVGDRYDLVVSLYGSASYLTQWELDRIPSLLNPGGRVFLMFYKPGYVPVTHTHFHIHPKYRNEPIPGATEFGNYQVVEYTKDDS